MATEDGTTWAEQHNTIMHWVATTQMYLGQRQPLAGVVGTTVSFIVPWERVEELSVCWTRIKMQYCDF